LLYPAEEAGLLPRPLGAGIPGSARGLYRALIMIFLVLVAALTSFMFFDFFVRNGIDRNLSAIYSLAIFAIIMASIFGWLIVSVRVALPR
jgi:hypothetical protein